MQMNAIFHCKEAQFEPKACVVGQIVQLDPREFDGFRCNLLRNHLFIAAFNSTMRAQEKGPDHCLLVLGEGCDDGILIRTEGYDYARYSSFIPGARQLLMADEQRAGQAFINQIERIEGAELSNARLWMEYAHSIAEADTGDYGPEGHLEYLRRLREFGDAFRDIDRRYRDAPAEIFNYKPAHLPEHLLPVADWIVNGGSAQDAYKCAGEDFFEPVKYAAGIVIQDRYNVGENKTYRHSNAVLQQDFALTDSQMHQVLGIVRNNAGVENLTVDDASGEFTVKFLPVEPVQTAPELLIQNDLEAMAARHTLWRLEQPDGVRADFFGRKLDGLYFEGLAFPDASFAGAVIEHCNLDEGDFTESDFRGTVLLDVTAFRAELDFTDFSGARLTDCTFRQADLVGAIFDGTAIQDCNFELANIKGADFSQAEIIDCTGLDDIAQGPVMAMGG